MDAGQEDHRIRSWSWQRCRASGARGITVTLFFLVAACGGASGTGSVGDTTQTPNPPPVTDVSDSTSPTIGILQPTTNATYSATGADLILSGTATDDVGLGEVSWTNSLGGSGNQTFSDVSANWSFNVTLQPGTNILTVTARDSTGNVRNAVLTVSYSTQTGQFSLTGRVDSSLIDRNGINAVYIYTGTVTPDDLGGAGSVPYAVTPVNQETGSCRWGYQFGSLPSGQYTLAFTNQAANDNAAANDAITFTGTTALSVQSGNPTTHDFAALRTLRVGSGKTYTRPSAAIAAASDGDVIEIDAGTYTGDVATLYRNNLTLRGVGGYAHLAANGANAGGKGTWVVKGNNTTVENIEFSGATVPDENGAGIRQEGNNLTVCHGYFHDNENGILGGSGDVLIEYSEFAYNGFGDGQSHNMYISDTNRFTLRYSYSHHAKIGHNVKSRAVENYILYNRIMDEVDGTSSYAIDLPDAGLSYIIGNLIQQGSGTDNSTIISYGAEQGLNPKKELYVVNNTIVNDLGSGTAIYVRSGTTAQIINNIFSGNGKVLSGPGTLTTNLISNNPGLVNIVGFDYRLTAASAGRDAGSDPGTVNGFSLLPVNQYRHKAGTEARPTAGSIDIGAYEYVP